MYSPIKSMRISFVNQRILYSSCPSAVRLALSPQSGCHSAIAAKLNHNKDMDYCEIGSLNLAVSWIPF